MTTEQYSIGYDAGYQDGFDAALAEPVEQEPVAVISESAIGLVKLHSNGACLPFGTQLYAAPVSVEAAVLAEREACAKVCAQLMTPWDENTPNHEIIALRNDGMRQCAAAIRARGEK